MTINIEKLKDSKEFLNIILENMDAAIFIADENFEIHQFNDSLIRLFDIPIEQCQHEFFGTASGCVNAVNENQPCGQTSKCSLCILRQSVKKCLEGTLSTKKQSLVRDFYINGRLEKKYLEFICRPIRYNDGKMVLVLMYDVTLLERSRQKLKEKQDQLRIDLDRAGQIQRSLLPPQHPDIPNLIVEWYFQPSLKIGGDGFHIYSENDHLVSCFMLDVSGHGVSAALVSVMVKQFLDYLHIKGIKKGITYQPGQILQLLERRFPFEKFGSYFTICYVVLNLETGEFVFSNAGHVPLVIVRKKGGIEVLEKGGSIIGINENSTPEQYTAVLSDGDKLILFTDGLIDYFGEKGEASNVLDFYHSLEDMAQSTAKDVVEKITEQRAKASNVPPADDISLIVLEFVPDIKD